MNDFGTADELISPSSARQVTAAAAEQFSRMVEDSKAVHWQSGLAMQVPAGDWRSVSFTSGQKAQLVAKRFFDVLLASMALLFLAPLLVIVALLVKSTSEGPVFFKQEREGMHGRGFVALKFRSMRTDDCDYSGIAQTQQDDPRITPIGRFLRKSSIDELPQLINVLRGDMSIVGPRPHVKGMRAGNMVYRELVPYYDYRLAVPPGLTGWAQANGLRGSANRADLARARVDHDVAYIQNFSIWLDIKTILITLREEFLTGSGN